MNTTLCLAQRLISLLAQTKLQLLLPEQINLYFPQLTGFVDLILITPNNYICFKDCWTANNLTPNILDNYSRGSTQINLNSDKKFIFILLKKNNDIIKYLSNNNILIQDYVIILQKNNLDKLLKDLSKLLYSEHIYFYDNDMDTIMLD